MIYEIDTIIQNEIRGLVEECINKTTKHHITIEVIETKI